MTIFENAMSYMENTVDYNDSVTESVSGIGFTIALTSIVVFDVVLLAANSITHKKINKSLNTIEKFLGETDSSFVPFSSFDTKIFSAKKNEDNFLEKKEEKSMVYGRFVMECSYNGKVIMVLENPLKGRLNIKCAIDDTRFKKYETYYFARMMNRQKLRSSKITKKLKEMVDIIEDESLDTKTKRQKIDPLLKGN